MLYEMSNKDQKTHLPYTLIAWVLLIGILILLTIVLLPRILRSIEESGVREQIIHYRGQSQVPQSEREGFLSFATLSTDQGTTIFLFPLYRTIIGGGSFYHELVERLLLGPTKEALSDGAITLIPTGTRLIGLTSSHQVLFVDLSKEFLTPTVFEEGVSLRSMQLSTALLADKRHRKVIILVEGNLIE